MKEYIIIFLANVAQLVEQLIRNEQVIGSSPIIGSTFSFLFLIFPYRRGLLGRLLGRFFAGAFLSSTFFPEEFRHSAGVIPAFFNFSS